MRPSNATTNEGKTHGSAKIKLLALSILFVLGCATTQYKHPEISSSAVKAEYDRQNFIRKLEFKEKIKNGVPKAKRLRDLSWPLIVSAAKFCDASQTDAAYGFSTISFESLSGLEPYKREAYSEVFNIPNKKSVVVIADITKGSVMESSGFKVLDQIIKVDGKKFKNKSGFLKLIDKGLYLNFGPYIDRKPKSVLPTKVFTVIRDGDVLDIKIRPAKVSKFPVVFRSSSQIGAFANGESVYINEGIMDFLEERELQFIIAHEIAHNINRHIEKRNSNALLAGVLGAGIDVLIGKYTGVQTSAWTEAGLNSGSFIYSKDFERESDYLGMYILANAKISTDELHKIWDKFSELHGNSGIYGSTHPSYPERYLSIISANKEIKNKIENGRKLEPEKK